LFLCSTLSKHNLSTGPLTITSRLSTVWYLAEHLDIDPDREPYLLWLAEVAMQAPLPRGWERHHQPAHAGGGITEFFHNAALDLTQWEHPFEYHFRAAVERFRQVCSEQYGTHDSGDLADMALVADRNAISLLDAEQ
jgi:hypothetical protein